MEVSTPPLFLPLGFLIGPRVVLEICGMPGAIFCKMPLIGNAVIYIIYGGDYVAMKKDGISIPPPANPISPNSTST